MNFKKIIFIILLLFLFGCQLNNTPTAKVEELLGKYQGLSLDFTNGYDMFIGQYDGQYVDAYKDIVKKQYRNMSYEVKNEEIDGNHAEVTVEIEVMDYKSIVENYTSQRDEDIHKKIIKELKHVKDKVTYTIIFSVTKNEKDIWEVDSLSDEIIQKLLGIY